VEGLGWEVRRQGVPYGGRGDVALQPGGDARGEVSGVARGQKEAGVVAAQPAEEVRGLLEERGGGVGGCFFPATRVWACVGPLGFCVSIGKLLLPRWSGPRLGIARPGGGRRMSAVVL
jgi:hypothetical protein